MNNAKQVWQATPKQLQVKVPWPSFQTWLKNTSIATFEEHKVVIAVPSNFVMEWQKSRYNKFISEVLNSVLAHKAEVKMLVQSEIERTECTFNSAREVTLRGPPKTDGVGALLEEEPQPRRTVRPVWEPTLAFTNEYKQ